jgi:hypothetical protein
MARPAVCGKPNFLATCAFLVMSRIAENAGLTSRLDVRSYALMPSSRSRGPGPANRSDHAPFLPGSPRVLSAAFLHYNYNVVAIRGEKSAREPAR